MSDPISEAEERKPGLQRTAQKAKCNFEMRKDPNSTESEPTGMSEGGGGGGEGTKQQKASSG